MKALLAGLLMVCAAACGAHPMPESRAWIDTQADGVRLTLELPLNRLEFAFGQPLSAAPAQVLPQHADALARYLLQHVGARDATAGWQVLRPTLAVRGSDSSAELEAVFDLRPPPGADARHFTLLLDAISHEVRTHRLRVFLRSDWAGGLAAGAPLPLDTLDALTRELPVALAPARAGGGFVPLLGDGALHIAEGSDHLVFLLLLLIVAPLAARQGRWAATRDGAGTLRRIAGIVTAFTLGHSLTLALGSSGALTPPAQWVEMAVAVTVALAAWQAFRPLWRRGEAAMALGFGLIHGLAFSASLSGAGLSTGRHALALLAFNLGIEAAQLAIVLLTVPALLRIVQRSAAAYQALRIGIAAAAFVLALLWLGQRAGLIDLPIELDAGRSAPGVFIAALWLLAGALRPRRRLTATSRARARPAHAAASR